MEQQKHDIFFLMKTIKTNYDLRENMCTSPLHLLHQLQQGLLKLAADGGSLVFSGDCAALPYVTSLLTRGLCMNQEEVRYHLETHKCTD